jgi:hypothetical protein
MIDIDFSITYKPELSMIILLKSCQGPSLFLTSCSSLLIMQQHSVNGFLNYHYSDIDIPPSVRMKDPSKYVPPLSGNSL